ncbi:hypothetical protein [Roseofilum sp. Guam]|uniref:hypothetical protein n=1 Tax=Roseofilum sp. Guam TaxID=2821502 RepID=UPI001B11154F|nr:hypothetical protein [Roseofilum sp. Guam]MBP0029981.1 hypothetical protein [Roseofilum sp. Guam]
MILRNRNAQKTLRHYEFSQAQSAIALWRGLGWSVWLVFSGIIGLQFLPYTMWRSQFILQPEDAQTLNGLLGTEALLLGIFALLLWVKK